MKALELAGTGLETLAFVERAARPVGPREVRLRVRAAALNYRDLAIARGEYGAYRRPLVLGSDAVGEVIEAGAGVTRFRVGERVCPHDTPDWTSGPPDPRALQRRLGGPEDGVFAEQVVVSEEAAVLAPAHLTDEEAATLCSAGVTAWQTLFVLAATRPGDVVVVQGTGGVSVFALQLARLAGAEVILLSRSEEKLAHGRALGATHVVATAGAGERDWEKQVLRITDGRGADLVVDVLGGASLARSIAATRVGGTVVALGFLEGTSATLDVTDAIRRSVTLRTSSGRSRESFEALCRAVSSSGMRPVVGEVFPFGRATDAFGALARGATFGKLVLRMA